MTLQELRDDFLKDSGIDVLCSGRKALNMGVKKLFIHVAKNIYLDKYGKKASVESISEFLNLSNDTTIHHLKCEIVYFFDVDPIIRTIYNKHFKEKRDIQYYINQVKKLEVKLDIQEKENNILSDNLEISEKKLHDLRSEIYILKNFSIEQSE
jgi:hypothetical protein